MLREVAWQGFNETNEGTCEMAEARAALWDLGGTLIDSAGLHWLSRRQAVASSVPVHNIGLILDACGIA